MNTILIVSVLAGGIVQGPPMELLAGSPNCRAEQLMLNAINDTNLLNNVDVRYTGHCVIR